VLSYLVMAGLGYAFSQRLYAIPFEWGRAGRVTLTAFGAFLLSLLAPGPLLPALAVKAAALLAFPVLLLASGFLSVAEWAWLRARVRV
jgi:hypothetical protein